MYSLTYMLISIMVFGKFSVLRKKAICTESVFANTRRRASFRCINRCNDIVPGNVFAASSRFPTLCPFPSFSLRLCTEVQ